MKMFEKKTMSNHDAKLLEVLTAENEELRANLDFVAVMSDVEIPGNSESEYMEVVTGE